MMRVPWPRLPPALREAFARLMLQRYGLSFIDARADSLDVGVERVAAALGAPGPAALLDRVEHGDLVALSALVRELTVGETYFLRTPQHFAFLRETLRQIAGARPQGPISLWSAGCATGEEAYSMAIVACEVLGPVAAQRIKILGTDINLTFLAHAKAGLYGEWSFREVPQEVRARWFERDGRRYRVLPLLREMVHFEPLNLLSTPDAAAVKGEPAEHAAWPCMVDVVFCRNVLIYFDAPSIERVAASLSRSLAPGGWLIPGPSDALLSTDGIERAATTEITAYRRAQGSPAAAAPPRVPSLEGDRSAGERSAGGRPAARARPARRRAPLAVEALLPAPAAPPAPALAPKARKHTLEDARALANRGDMTAALEQIDRVIAADALLVDAYVLRATILSGLSDHTRAAADADRAILLDPGAAFAHMLAAMSKASLGQLGAARRSLRNAQKLLQALAPEAIVPGADGAPVASLLAACRDLARVLPAETDRGLRGGAVG